MQAPRIYRAVNQEVLACVPRTARRILDIGCGSGAFAERLKQELGAHVVGITYSAEEAQEAARCADQVHVTDLNTFDFSGLEGFDCAVMSHVLEHLYEPAAVLRRLKAVLAPDATIVIALPNVLMWRQRFQFLRGRFRYTEFGIMDQTHFRFFDVATAGQLVQDAGYRLIRRADAGHFPMPGVRPLMGRAAAAVDRFAMRLLPGLFADQFVLVATPEPGN